MGPAHFAVVALLILAGGTIANYVLNYMTTYATATLHMPAQAAFGATVVNGLTNVIFSLFGGWLSDRYGRKPVMIWPWLALLVLILPSFFVLSQLRTTAALWGATAVLGTAMSISAGASLVAITESLPKRSRAGVLSLVYALSIATFGGSAQFVVAWLTDLTKNNMAPAWYMAAATAIALAAMFAVRETAPVKTASSPGLGLAEPVAV
jgi:MHS family citrate/tricarballylate:H+ symporter-like MFS transporter